MCIIHLQWQELENLKTLIIINRFNGFGDLKYIQSLLTMKLKQTSQMLFKQNKLLLIQVSIVKSYLQVTQPKLRFGVMIISYLSIQLLYNVISILPQ